MISWKFTALILCGFGLFKEFRPSEPFFTEYLMDFKNIPQNDIVHIAFPIWTYTYLGTLAVVFLVTDFLRYRSIIIFEGIAYVVTWILITWGKGLTSLIFIEMCYGIACSTEVAYFTYIYGKVDKEHYQKVTSYTYTAIFFGRFLGGVTGQLLVSFDLMDYHELNYISLVCVCIAVGFSLCLPSVDQSIYFHRRESSQEKTSLTFTSKIKLAGKFLFKDFKEAYSSMHVLKWSLWWAFATSGHLQVINFIQALWETVNSENSDVDSQLYNGAVEAIHTLLSAILAFGVGHVKVNWGKWGDIFLGVVSLIQGGVLYWMATTNNLYIAYASYIIYRMFYQVVITIASAEVAQKIREDSYALIFGINTFAALAIQTILTLIVADDVGLALSERDQFKVYGGYHGVLGIVFVCFAFMLSMRICLKRQEKAEK